MQATTIRLPAETEHATTKPRAPRNPVLAHLDVLVGDWAMRASIGGQPTGLARSHFEWHDDGAFLAQHVDAARSEIPTPAHWLANSPFPINAVFGLDDASAQLVMLYADGRGVRRIYQMSLCDNVWKIWRDAPGFFQRFTGVVSDDGKTITAYWEGSRDGSTWTRDFDMTYTKQG